MHGSLLTASLLAADLTATVDRPRTEVRGFMLRDARFFFLLFRNWLELDLREPDTDIDLTQIRRACDQLAARRRISVVPPPRRPRSARRQRTRYVLTLAGVLALVDELVAWSPDRTFEEGLFVVLFAASYRALVIRRAEQAGAPVARKHVAKALDPRAVIASLHGALTKQLADLEERMASGDALFHALPPGVRAAPATRRSWRSSSASRRTSSTTCARWASCSSRCPSTCAATRSAPASRRAAS